MSFRSPAGDPNQRERPEPGEAPRPMPLLVLVLILAISSWGAAYLMLYGDSGYPATADLVSQATDAAVTDTPSPVAASGLDGSAIYQGQCVACHQADGQGLTGAFPPLVGSRWVVEDDATPIRILLFGMQGEIEVLGQTYNGLMPNLNLSDEEIAAVLSYIRGEWGNEAPAVSSDRVAEIRAGHAGRSAPWQGGVELIEAGR